MVEFALHPKDSNNVLEFSGQHRLQCPWSGGPDSASASVTPRGGPVGTCGPCRVQACPGYMAGGCMGWDGSGQVPVSVAPQDSLDADCSLVQGLAPLYRQQGFLVFLGWERSHHAAALPHPYSPTCSQKSGCLRLFPHGS